MKFICLKGKETMGENNNANLTKNWHFVLPRYGYTYNNSINKKNKICRLHNPQLYKMNMLHPFSINSNICKSTYK